MATSTIKLNQTHEALLSRFGQRVSNAMPIREQHGKDESYHEPAAPDMVVYPQTTAEVVEIVKLCKQQGVPLIPYGAGTSLEGQVTAVHGGVCMDMSNMNQILTVNAEDLDVVVQPGVRRKQLNTHLRDMGLFFSVDPGADASLGGMAATRASGTNAVRYGTMRDVVLAMEVVLADGRVIRTARRARKSSAGYDLTRLFVGSEGTLGVITELTLRLQGIPEAIAAASCTFPDVASAVNAVIMTIQCGIPMARIELLDSHCIEAINKFSKLSHKAEPTLFFELHGSPIGVEDQTKSLNEVCKGFGASEFVWALAQEERSKLWQARHDAAYAVKAMRPGCEQMATDVCVPISRLAECIVATQQDVAQSGLYAPVVGHVGDGNFHLVLTMDPNDSDEIERAHALHSRLVMRAIEMDGTCTGEHGIGTGKRDFLSSELGLAVDVMQQIKQALDPDGMMNPGKIFQD